MMHKRSRQRELDPRRRQSRPRLSGAFYSAFARACINLCVSKLVFACLNVCVWPQVSRSACMMTTAVICKLLRSKEASAAVDVRSWPPVLDTGKRLHYPRCTQSDITHFSPRVWTSLQQTPMQRSYDQSRLMTM